MNSAWKLPQSKPGRQAGMTLIEMLVAGVVSIIAVSAMLIMMANTLGTGRQTIEFSRMSAEMRTGMQIMTRELRRANYHADFLQCYGNVGCRTAINTVDSGGNPVTIDISSRVSNVNVSNTNDCMWFWYDRPQSCNQASCTQAEMAALQNSVLGEAVAAFRVDDNWQGTGVATLQMMTTTTGAPNCNADANWVNITDPNFVDIQAFTVANAGSICEDFGTAGASQVVERIALTLTARPVCDASIADFLDDNDCQMAERTMEEFIKVRNNFTSATACP